MLGDEGIEESDLKPGVYEGTEMWMDGRRSSSARLARWARLSSDSARLRRRRIEAVGVRDRPDSVFARGDGLSEGGEGAGTRLRARAAWCIRRDAGASRSEREGSLPLVVRTMGLPHLSEPRRFGPAAQGASEVTLQDYNREVLVELTIPNATANLQRDGECADAEPSGSCRLRYLAGDWARLHEHLEAHAYDVILTSDTVYSVANLPKLYQIIKHVRAGMWFCTPSVRGREEGCGRGW